jgi:hypothetical protein
MFCFDVLRITKKKLYVLKFISWIQAHNCKEKRSSYYYYYHQLIFLLLKRVVPILFIYLFILRVFSETLRQMYRKTPTSLFFYSLCKV